jgi:hypothetical protein
VYYNARMKDIAAPPKFFRPAAVENNFSQKSTAIF